jgi:hypothetical protein
MIREERFAPKPKLGLVPAVKAATNMAATTAPTTQSPGLDGTYPNLTPVRDSGFGKTGPIADPAIPTPTPVRDSGFGKTGPIPDPVAPTPAPTPQPPMSTGYPPLPQTPTNTGNPLNGAPPTPGSLGLDFMRQVTPNELVQNQLNGLLQSDSPYIKNARQRGAEYAASRGNINSSIGAGASQRAALEAALPIAESDAGVYRDANQGNFESLNELRKMRTAAELDNWLGSESYTRDFNGRLAMIPINSGADMLAYITQRALEDPAVYTPDVISGFNNFFNLNMKDMFKNFFTNGGGP